jgi:hypothetical protein
VQHGWSDEGVDDCDMSDVGKVLMEQQQVGLGLPFAADGRPARVVEPRGGGRWTQRGERRFTQPGPHEDAVLMHWVGAYPSTNRDLALRRHVDADASGVVDEAGVAGDDMVPVDPAEAERIGPVSAPILERNRCSIGGAVQDDSGTEGASTERFPADLVAGRHHVPTIAGVDLCQTAAG